jgi:propionyl-CoA carboxylase beta chain
MDAMSEKDSRRLLDEIETAKAALEDTARPDAVARQHKRAEMTARERIAQLCEPGSFREFGGLAFNKGSSREEAPADGTITGVGRIDGRWCVILSQDFTVFGGSIGETGSTKTTRAGEVACEQGMPLVMLLDGGGHRIQGGQNSRHFAKAGPFFHNLARMSGWVPMVAAMLGAGFAGPTNYAGMADFVVMVRGGSTMGLAGPALVKAGTGEEIGTEELGGAAAQVDKHGLADLGVETEAGALDAVKRYLSYLPSNARQPLPVIETTDPADRREDKLLDLVPANTRRAYDMRKVVDRIVDEGSGFEIKPTFANNILTTMARLAGRPVGIIANQPMRFGGMLTSDACDKAAHFIAICDAFGLPLIYLIDVPGFAIGSGAERTVLGRHSAKMVYELGQATVPRISIVLRKGYGLGYFAMCGGRSFAAEASLAWPTAEICAMSVEGSVDVAYRKQYEAAEDPQAKRQEIIDAIRDNISVLDAAAGFGIDDIIDPRDTRRVLIEILERAPARRDNRLPPRYRSIVPI